MGELRTTAAGPEVSRVTMAGRASFEDIIWHANMFYKALAAASSGAPPTALWNFFPTNASDDVKKHATRVTSSNEDEGFAGAIDMILKM